MLLLGVAAKTLIAYVIYWLLMTQNKATIKPLI